MSLQAHIKKNRTKLLIFSVVADIANLYFPKLINYFLKNLRFNCSEIENDKKYK